MKTEEQKSAFILRVEEMVKEIETLMQEGGGNERSCILLVNIIGKTKCDEVQNQTRLLDSRSSPKRKATKISHTRQI